MIGEKPSILNYIKKKRKVRPYRSTNNGEMIKKAKRDVVSDWREAEHQKQYLKLLQMYH